VARYELLLEQMLQAGAQPQAIYDLMRTRDPAFGGSLSAIKRACARIGRQQGMTAGTK
jgi:hypothetical protein